MQDKPVLVTGAAGAVGHLLVPELQRSGRRVVATDLPERPLPRRAKGLGLRPADLLDPTTATRLVRGCSAVIHTAAVDDFDAPLEALAPLHVEATLRLYQAAGRAGVLRFVHFGCALVYRPDPAGLYREESPLGDRCGFERSKVQAELALREAAAAGGPELILLRPSFLYGPRAQGAGAALACLPLLLQERSPALLGLQGGPRHNWCHAQDAARAAVHLLQHGQAGEAYNLADHDAPTLGELLDLGMAGHGLQPPWRLPAPPKPLLRAAATLASRAGELTGPLAGLDRTLETSWAALCQRRGLKPALVPRIPRCWLAFGFQDWIVQNDKLVATGFEPLYPSIRHGWPATMAWYREQGWLPS